MAKVKAKKPRGGWPTLAEIAEAQRELVLTLPTMKYDMGAAASTCWGCGYGTDRFRPTKAHIIARSNGGTLKPTNFLLLCEKCHDHHPDGATRAEQIEWLRNRENWQVRGRRLMDPIWADLRRVASELGGEELLQRWLQAHSPTPWLPGAVLGGAVLAERYRREADTVTAGPHNLYPNMGAAMIRSLRGFAAMSASSMEAVGFYLGIVAWATECVQINADNIGKSYEEHLRSCAQSFA